MIRLLIICAFAHTATTYNATSKEVAEAYKYFKSIHAMNSAATTTENLTNVLPVPPKPNDLLAVLHNLRPLSNLPHIKPLDLPKPLVESREITDVPSLEDHNETLVDHSEMNKAVINEVEKQKYLGLLKHLLGSDGGKSKITETKARKTTDNISQADNRRIMEWFTHLFGRKSTTQASTEFNLEVLPPQKSLEVNVLENLTEVLYKVDSVLEKLNQRLEEEKLKSNKSDAYFVLKLPVKPKTDVNDVRFRKKRDLSGIDKLNNKIRVAELTKESKATNHTVTGNSLKSKILAYLIDSFNEIKYKIAPLAKIKKAHLSSDLYKIGYITASVDTLEENLNKLMKDLDKNKNVWDENKIMELFDKLKTSNRVLRTLMDYLESITNKKQLFDVKTFVK